MDDETTTKAPPALDVTHDDVRRLMSADRDDPGLLAYLDGLADRLARYLKARDIAYLKARDAV